LASNGKAVFVDIATKK